MSRIAYQIVIKGNEISEKYAELSRASFQPLLDAGIISEIRIFDAITPDSDNFEEHKARYVWHKSIMKADIAAFKGKDVEMHSPTEMAGMCSHWELMRMASESEDRFLVIEHDTWFYGDVELFEELIEMDVLYCNIGLFMGCYMLERQTAVEMYGYLTVGEFPINCGPYCTLQRLFATYTTDTLKQKNYRGYGDTVIHPWAVCDTIGIGRNVQIYFNKIDSKPKTNPYRVPTTQVISKSLLVTQDHHSYQDKHLKEPWTRNKCFHVID